MFVNLDVGSWEMNELLGFTLELRYDRSSMYFTNYIFSSFNGSISLNIFVPL